MRETLALAAFMCLAVSSVQAQPSARFLPSRAPGVRQLEHDAAIQDAIADGVTVLAVFPEGCPASVALRPYFHRLAREYPYAARYLELLRPLSEEEIPEHLRGVASYPLVLVIRDSTFLDLKRGALMTNLESENEANLDDLKHLLARNALIKVDPAKFMRPAQGKGPVVMRRAYLSRRDLAGAMLKGSDLAGSIIAGVRFVGADLRDTNLTGAVISHTDFRGANLDGAKLDGTVWLNVICPDGSSTGNKGTCVGRTRPAPLRQNP